MAVHAKCFPGRFAITICLILCSQVYAGLNQETGQIMAVKVQSSEKNADKEKQAQQLQVIQQVCPPCPVLVA